MEAANIGVLTNEGQKECALAIKATYPTQMTRGGALVRFLN